MNGYAVIDKPRGVSSSRVTIGCRNALSRALGYRVKCGHMGTLDPEAEGVLVVAFGKMPRLFDLIAQTPKRYRAELTFGQQTDTLDRAGEIVATAALPTADRVEHAVNQWIGTVMQVPPAYSAVHCNGARAYDLARQGKDVTLQAKQITIYELSVIDRMLTDAGCAGIRLDVRCSSGTYIRSLCRDIALDAGSVGYMSALTRTECAGECLDRAVAPQVFESEPLRYLHPIEEKLQAYMPICDADGEIARKIRCGIADSFGWEDGLRGVRIDGRLYGVCNTTQGITKASINLWDDREN